MTATFNLHCPSAPTSSCCATGDEWCYFPGMWCKVFPLTVVTRWTCQMKAQLCRQVAQHRAWWSAEMEPMPSLHKRCSIALECCWTALPNVLCSVLQNYVCELCLHERNDYHQTDKCGRGQEDGMAKWRNDGTFICTLPKIWIQKHNYQHI